jgi:hypothetical protein
MSFTPAWEDVTTWEERGVSPATKLAMEHLAIQRDAMADRPDGGPSCIVYDEDLAEITLSANDQSALLLFGKPEEVVLKETDAFARQNDKGPYHWAQGPLDLHGVTPAPVTPVTPPVTPSPNPEPVKPNTLPRKGKAVTTTNLRLRVAPNAKSLSRGVMITGTEVLLTGGRKRVEGSLWVRVEVATVELSSKKLSGDDKWLTAPPKQRGWVNSNYLAIPASEYVAADFPPVTHEFTWWLEDAGGLNASDVRRTLTAIGDDPRGPFRAGVNLREADSSAAADVLIRFVQSPCSGAAGCYYKRSGEKARVDIGLQYFNTLWLSRVFLHETLGHAATRCYDHYNGAPQYPRPDYFGLMGNWQDRFGDHAWPDNDDIENMIAWKEGRSDLVFVRDTP